MHTSQARLGPDALLYAPPPQDTHVLLQAGEELLEAGASPWSLHPTPADDATETTFGNKGQRLQVPPANTPNLGLEGQSLVRKLQHHKFVDNRPARRSCE